MAIRVARRCEKDKILCLPLSISEATAPNFSVDSVCNPYGLQMFLEPKDTNRSSSFLLGMVSSRSSMFFPCYCWGSEFLRVSRWGSQPTQQNWLVLQLSFCYRPSITSRKGVLSAQPHRSIAYPNGSFIRTLLSSEIKHNTFAIFYATLIECAKRINLC